jgi:hypothetical protein
MEQRSRGWLPFAATMFAATVVLASPGPASARETIMLDTHGQPGASYTGPVQSAPLTAGARYYARVSGTTSIYRIDHWKVARPPCGTPEATPQYPSPGVPNGPVGMDAETVFGVTAYAWFHGYSCSAKRFPFRLARYTDGGVQFSQGGAFARPVPVGGPREIPRADHTYVYELIGAGLPLSVRWVDRPLEDDYGQFKVEVLTEAECAAQRCVEEAQPERDTKIDPDSLRGGAGTSPARCVSRRRFPVRVRTYRGLKMIAGVLYVRGKVQPMTLDGRRLQAMVDLRGLPLGTYRIRIVAESTRGQRVLDDRRYRTCRRKPAPRG